MPLIDTLLRHYAAATHERWYATDAPALIFSDNITLHYAMRDYRHGLVYYYADY